MIGSHEDAEDVTQEVFLQVHRKLHTYRGDASLSTWLHRVTVNAVLMHFRRSKKWSSETQTEDGDIEAINLPTSERKSDSLMVDRLALKKAVAHLSPGCQTIFMLHDVEGYEHKEIAQRLGISEGTSKSQLHDARLKMRKHLNGQSLPAATRR
jgi:RNA polymerase sigma-70 factor (ECF subfamily)